MPGGALKRGLIPMIYVLRSASRPVRCNSIYFCFKVHLTAEVLEDTEVD